MMFGVEALKDSRKFSEAHFGDVSAVQGTTVEKVFITLHFLMHLLFRSQSFTFESCRWSCKNANSQ